MVSTQVEFMGGAHTVKFSKVKQRVPATDLRGPKAFAESLTPRSNLAMGDTVDSSLDLSSSAAGLGSKFS